MKKLILLFLFFYYTGKAQSGKEAWHWVFGSGCTLDFSSGVPVPGTNQLSSYEGCASISDPNTGQLLFYTNGSTVYSAPGNGIMHNGLNLYGNQSGTQSALIIPKPDSSQIFYLITLVASENVPNKGVHYSVIDMSLYGGAGAVTLKNKALMPPPSTEKLTGVRHCNGKDYWIIAHPYLSDAFNAYLVTSAGIDTIPVVSHAGTLIQDTINNPFWWEGGYLKASPDGKKLALAESNTLHYLEIYDFNNATGTVSNAIKINYTGQEYPYGVSFSPDNSKLYTSCFSGRIYQYDVSSGNPTNILASQILIQDSVPTPGTGPHAYWGEAGALQIAPDGKIYIARYSIDTLGVINNPNNSGASCNCQINGLPLNHPTTSNSYYGLPNFMDANSAGINLTIPDVKQCNIFSADTLTAGSGFVSYQWNTGVTTNSLVINNPGKYWVTVTNQNGCSKTDTVYAYLITPEKTDTTSCAFYKVNATQNAALTYNWYDGSTNPIKTFTNTGVYWVAISYVSGGCSVKDSFNLVINTLPAIDLGRDTVFCRGNLVLDASNPSSEYDWNTGQVTPSITVEKPGTYWVKVTDIKNCVNYDTLIVRPERNLFDFIMPNIVTPNNDKINDEIDFGKYQFSALQIEIYNRWGIKVFESADPNCIWKPTSDDVDGTYFTNLQYRIDCVPDSQTKSIKGFITLVK